MRHSTPLALFFGTLALACPPPVYTTVTVWEDEDPTPTPIPTPTTLSTVTTSTTVPVIEQETTVAEAEQTPPPVEVAPPTTTLITVATPATTVEPSESTSAPASDPVPTSGSSTGTSDSGNTGGSSAAVSGEATFYGGNLAGGTCSFTGYTLPSGLFGTAFSGSAWDSASNCGSCVQVTGPNGNSITAMVVDQCPECNSDHLDLFQNAFAELGSISAGIISISYKFVSCGITSPITLQNKSGTSQYWFSMQVVNSNEPVTSLEVSTDGGSTWQATTRRDYNFFENPSGFGTTTVDVRVTSKSGQSIVVSNVSVASDSKATASSNF
ncbi:barwin-like endoglucanase [Thozetella sp. PMI_491]|nr:barwin-like endoglucanase [Thozetella sp. PMI_491]